MMMGLPWVVGPGHARARPPAVMKSKTDQARSQHWDVSRSIPQTALPLPPRRQVRSHQGAHSTMASGSAARESRAYRRNCWLRRVLVRDAVVGRHATASLPIVSLHHP